MKKLIAFICTAVIVATFTVIPSFSADLSEMINVYRNQVNIEVNGTRVGTDNFLYNGTTYIPLRAVSELLEKEVGWNSYSKVASINDKKYEKEALSQLLPSKTGYKWFYDGFAEYSHQLELIQILDEAQKRTYVLQGEVGDPSGGESNLNRQISIKYIIEENCLIQEKQEEAMLDSKYDRLTLIQAPLQVGTFWPETVVDKKGNETLINSQITKVELADNGKKEYTVRYQDTKSKYYEERIIKEGAGIVSYEKLLELQDSSFPVNYFLFLNEEIKNVDVKLYFPDRNAEKVHLEQRTIQVQGVRTAEATVNALISGPSEASLTGAIPQGTKLLTIYIQDRICFVNFSQEFLDNHPGGTAGESMTLAAIVNTLTEFDSIDKVQILVEGKSGISLGHNILDQPLERMNDLIG